MNNQVYIRIVATYTFADKLEIGFEKGNPPDEFGHFKEDITVCREDSSLGITCDITTKRTFLITDLAECPLQEFKIQETDYTIITRHNWSALVREVQAWQHQGWLCQGTPFAESTYVHQAMIKEI